MSGFDRRLKELLDKVRLRAEAEGIQWRKADKDVYAFRAGPYVITFAKERDPLIAIYDENGEELEAIDRADLEARTSADGKPLLDVNARIWRLGRRGAGVSASALDRVLDWLDERVDDDGAPKEGAVAPRVEAQPQTGIAADAGLAPQAPQAPQPDPQPAHQDEPETERRDEHRSGANGNGGPRPPWAQ